MKIVIIGCGGHAKSVVDVLTLLDNYEIVGYVKPFKNYEANLFNIPCLGVYDDLPEIKKYVKGFFVAIGDNLLRMKMFEQVLFYGFTPINIISPFSYISKYAEIGIGNLIMHGTMLNPGVVLENNIIINTRASIDHECRISSHVHIAPGAVLTGKVNVEERAFIGAGAIITPDIIINKNSIVGAGSIVINNVLENKKVAGNPAKELK